MSGKGPMLVLKQFILTVDSSQAFLKTTGIYVPSSELLIEVCF